MIQSLVSLNSYLENKRLTHIMQSVICHQVEKRPIFFCYFTCAMHAIQRNIIASNFQSIAVM